jgi:LysR family transcriptional regulator, glycine cleavage system transcriptional activator
MDRQRAPRLSLDLLRGFRAAARHLSFTLAARELFVTQSAISHQVKALEEQIGRPLFRRVNRALQLTATGDQLYRAVDEALTLIDTATQRVVDPARTLSVTTTVALASTWLVPRLPRFQKAHPDIDLRVFASNDVVDLARENLDVALRFATLQMPTPRAEKLFDYKQFPVCSPALARSRSRPLRTVADLSHHVLIDFETVLYGRVWFDWQRWSSAMGLRDLRGVGWMRLSHYDQVIEAARKGSGVAVGKWPHVTDDLCAGRLVAPLGKAGAPTVGGFYLEVTASAERDATQAFVNWLRREARLADEQAMPFIEGVTRRRRTGSRSPRAAGGSRARG